MKYYSVRTYVETSKGILFCRREDNGLWEMPGGQVNKGESILSAAVRELFEETGITAKKGVLIGEHVIRGNRQAVIKCTNISGKLTPSWESPEVSWIKNFEKDRRVKLYTKELIREIHNNNDFFVVESRKFEPSLVIRYLMGKVKRKIRSKKTT